MMNKQEFLKAQEMRVVAHLQLARTHFEDLPQDVLLKPSSTGGWSIAQCLDHLNSYGHYYLPRLKEAVAKPGHDESFKSGWLGNYFTNMMEPSDKKYKAFKNHIPVMHPDASAVLQVFIKQQEDLIRLLRTASSSDLNTRIPISITKFIKLKLGDTFRFLIAHNERHIQQALRNL